MNSENFLSIVFASLLWSLSIQASQWQVEEVFDAEVTLPIFSVHMADDGMLWRSYQNYNSHQYYSPGFTWIERINPNNGNVVNRIQIIGRDYNFKPDRNGRVWMDSGRAVKLLSTELNVLETRGGSISILPEYRLFNSYSPLIDGEEILSYGSLGGTKLRRPTKYTSYQTVVSSEAGLWLSGNSAMVKVNLQDGSFSQTLTFSACGQGTPYFLSEARVLFGRCLIDLSSQQIIRTLTESEQLVGARQGANPILLLRQKGLVRAVSGNSGNVMWGIPISGAPEYLFFGETLILRSSDNLLGYNAATGQMRFSINIPTENRPMYGDSTRFVTSSRLGTNVYSSTNGELERFIPPSQIIPVAISTNAALTEDAVYISSIFVKNANESIAQLSKRSRADGALLWRKTYAHTESSTTSCDNCAPPGTIISASNQGVAWSIVTLASGARHSACFSLNPIDGSTNWSRQSIVPLANNGGEFYSMTDLGNGSILLDRYNEDSEIRDARSGILRWTTDRTPRTISHDGDLLKEVNGSVERLDGLTGVRRWISSSANLSENNRYGITPEELIYKASNAIWSPISNSQLVLNRLDYLTGAIKTQTVTVPSQFVSARGPVTQYGFAPAPAGVPIHIRLSMPNAFPSYLVVPPSGTPLLLASNDDWYPRVRERGLGRSAYGAGSFYEDHEGSAGESLFWMDEIDLNGVKNWWQALPPNRSFGRSRVVEHYFAQTLSSERIFLERDYDGTKVRYYVSQALPIDSPLTRVELSISKEFLGISVRGELQYKLRVENTGPNAARDAYIFSELAHVNSFSCMATNGTCDADRTFGTLSARLNLEPGGFAEFDVLDVSGQLANAIGVVSSSDQIEGNIANNVVFIGATIRFANGFEQ